MNQKWTEIENNFITNQSELKYHMIHLDILKMLFTYNEILNYAKENIKIKNLYWDVPKTHAFDTDYIMYVRPIEYHEATDDYGRIIPNKYIKVQYYDVKRRIDRHLVTSANNLLVEITKGILKQNLKDENLINFIDNIDLRCFYLTNPEHKIAWGGIKIENFNKNFSDLDFLLFHESDKTGNYFGTYEKTTKRMCNRIEYYVNMKKLAQYVKKCKES